MRMGVQKLAKQPLCTENSSLDEVDLETLSISEGVIAHFNRPKTPSPTTVAVISDPHIATEASGTWKMYHRTQDLFQRTLTDLGNHNVDAVVIAGDLTKDGEEQDLDWIQTVLDGLTIPVLAVPGNHDIKELNVTHFEDQFTGDGFPVHLSLNEIDIIGLNSTVIPGEEPTDDGVVSADQLDWLEEMLPDMTNPIVVMHHNLPGLREHIGDHGWQPHPPVENSDALLEILSRHDVPLHLSGHVHLLSLILNERVRELIVPPLSSFPQAYLLLEIDDTGTTVRWRTAANREAIEEAYNKAQSHSIRSRIISRLNTEQFHRLPLLDERIDPLTNIEPIYPTQSDTLYTNKP
jgi:3',5'-cyclic-AMP phosphodiesterase